MMKRKFTDDEIVKELECCREKYCCDCPMSEYPQTICEWDVCDLAIDLINRQKAEIERLKSDLHDCIREVSRSHEIDKNKGIKEFSERLKKEIRDACFAYEADSQCEYIDNLVQEMIGENNGN